MSSFFSKLGNAVAAPFVAPTKAVIDIASGKNIVNSGANAYLSATTAAPDLINKITQKKLSSVPLVGGYLNSSSNFQDNGLSRKTASDVLVSQAKIGATVLAAPVVGAELGVGTTASYFATGSGIEALSKGKISQAAEAFGVSGMIPNFQEYKGIASGILDSIPKIPKNTGYDSVPVPNLGLNPIAGSIGNLPPSNNGGKIILVVLVLTAGYLLIKKGA